MIITSDHGESWGEHGVVDHGTSLYNEQVSIPLIIKPPRGVRITQIDEPVSLVDVTATLSDFATGRVLGGGTSLRDSSAARRSAQMQYFGNEDQFRVDDYGAMDELMRASVVGTLKVIDMSSRVEMYDLARDTQRVLDESSYNDGQARATPYYQMTSEIAASSRDRAIPSPADLFREGIA